jgi:hypothetical protein
VREFYDAAVSGADPVESREGFDSMLTYMLSNGARMVLVESASRFARDLVVQITGHAPLKKQGIELAVDHCLMPKLANEPGLEDADFIANIAGSMAQWRFVGPPGFPRDFRAGFHNVPGSCLRYMHISGVSVGQQGDDVVGVELKDTNSSP